VVFFLGIRFRNVQPVVSIPTELPGPPYSKLLLIFVFVHTNNTTNVTSRLTLLPVPIGIISNSLPQSFMLRGGYFRHLKSSLLDTKQGVPLARLSSFCVFVLVSYNYVSVGRVAQSV